MEKEFIIKRVLLISLLLIVGCAKPINENSLVDRNGVKYQQDSQNPYLGEVFDLYNNGNKKLEGSYKNGKKNGKWTVWYENGQKWSEINYKNGKLDELWTQWNENGQKKTETTYKDGEIRLATKWYANGQKHSEETYRDGKEDGKWTYWYDNGKKKYGWKYKNGEKDGLETYWYANGQKASEGTHNDGELILQKCWDEDGNECVCSDLFGFGCK